MCRRLDDQPVLSVEAAAAARNGDGGKVAEVRKAPYNKKGGKTRKRTKKNENNQHDQGPLGLCVYFWYMCI